MIIIISESAYRKRMRRIRTIKRLLIEVPLVCGFVSAAFAIAFWWSH
jgi:hypothetical protein